jgi:lipid II:glycine glycyltransferase (peptidoglycan interpeptide bridge formation enzyme)
MEINICQDKNSWEKQAISPEYAEFLQSWEWGEFQKAVGNKVVRLLIQEGDTHQRLQGFVHKLPLSWKYLYIPRFQISDLGFQIFCDWARKQGFVFIRCESVHAEILNHKSQIQNSNRQPQTTLILDLNKDEETLLSEMHSKTRYNINLAERKGIRIEEKKDVDIFWKLNQETKERDDFKSHDKNYYKKMLQLPIVHQLTAYYENEPIASNICISYGNVFTYLHGASSNNYRNLMAPYLLQWEQIKLAKRMCCKFYDFWGISPRVRNKDKGVKNKLVETCFHNLCWQADHKWTGVTRFKAGFGGQVKEYPGAVDVVFRKMSYKLYEVVKSLKRH